MNIDPQSPLPHRRSFHRHALIFDRLEDRHLLAADVVTSELVVVDDGWTDADEQTRVIRVYNDGDHTVRDVHVRSLLSNELDDASWTRRAAFGRFADFEPNPTAVNSAFANSFFDLEPIGDVNGDGLLDGTTRTSKYFNSNKIPEVIFGGLANPSNESINDGPTGFLLPGPLGFGVQGLGDINGDGFDDLSHGNRVIFGSTDLGTDLGTTELDEAALDDAGFSLEGINRITAIGDINGDGLDDFSASHAFQGGIDLTYLIWGQESKEQLQSLTLDALAADSNRTLGMVVQGASNKATGIQDINGDGLADAAFERFTYVGGFTQTVAFVLFGNDDVMDLPDSFEQLDGSNGFGVGDLLWTGTDVHGQTPVASTGDVNGDGFADFAIGYNGRTDCFCTATDKETLQVSVGAAIVFGGPDVGADGHIGPAEGDAEPRNYVQLTESVLYGSRVHLAVVDINADGYADIQVNDSVVFGGENITDHDLDEDTLNGEDGFRTDSRFVTWMAPTGEHLDEMAASLLSHGGEIWRHLDDQDQVFATGSDDIDERFDLLPQTSFVYEVTGHEKLEPQPIVTTIAGGLENVLEDLTNNVAPREQSIVYLEVEPTEPTGIEPGKPTSFEIHVTNHGPETASDLQILESYSHGLDDPTWTRTERTFPSEVDLDDLASFGVSREGRTQGLFDQETIARSMGAGDYNGDGIADIFLSIDHQIQLSFGGANFGAQELRGTTVLAESARDVGDVNGDGFDDIMLDGSKLLLGHAGIGDSERLDLNESPHVVILESTFGASNAYAIGDVNADGFGDVAFNIVGPDDFMPQTEPEGRIHVVYGSGEIGGGDSLDLSMALGFELTNNSAENVGSFRAEVASLGDTNGDGIDDFAIGADNGQAYVVFGSSNRLNEELDVTDLDTSDGYRLELPLTESFDSEFEPTLAVAGGDINGDGLQDVLVGASWLNEARGEVFVVYGSRTGVPEAALTDLGSNGTKIVGELVGDYMGASLSSGDLNNDGFDDIVIGGGNARLSFLDEAQYTGSVYVVYGSDSPAAELSVDSLDGQNGFRLDNRLDTELSTRVVVGFDVNADGLEDLLIGDPGFGNGSFSPQSPGAAYLIYGRAETSATGQGPIDDQIELPANAQVTYTITGTVPESGLPAQLPGLATLLPAASQINLNATSSAHAAAVAPTLPRQSPFQQQIVVSYLASESLTKTSIGDDDIEVVLPNGERVIAEFVRAKVFSDRSLQATYALEAIGGLWEASDNGTYEVHLREDEVLTNDVAILPASLIGSFEVAIPENRATAPDLTQQSPFGQRTVSYTHLTLPTKA